MGSKQKAPPPPDYTKLALEQARLQNEMIDKQTAANRVNQVTPFGTITWSQDPVTGQWQQVEAWNDEMVKAREEEIAWTGTQRAFESERMDFERQRMAQESLRMQEQMGYDKQRADYEVERMQRAGAFEQDLMEFERQRMGHEGRNMEASEAYNAQRAAFENLRMGFAGDQMNFARDQMDTARSIMDRLTNMGDVGFQAPALPQYSGYGGGGGAYADDFMKSAMMRLAPQQARETEALSNKLRLQGLQPGTEAYDTAYRNLTTSHGDVNAKAAIDAGLAGSKDARETYLAQLQGQGQGFQQSMQAYLLPWQVMGHQVDIMNGVGGGSGGFGAGIGQGIGGDIYGNAGAGINYNIGQGSSGNDIYGGAGQGIGTGFGSNIGPVGTNNYQSYNQAALGEAPDIMGAAQQQYAQQMQAYNEAQQKKSSKGGSIGSLVGAVGGSFFGMPTLGASIGGGIGSAFSDMRLKSDVEVMSDVECYEKLKKIVPISWRWNGTSVRDSGISAQEILAELPHLTDRAERGMLAVNYTALFAMLLGAFRHLATLAEAPKESGNAAV